MSVNECHCLSDELVFVSALQMSGVFVFLLYLCIQSFILSSVLMRIDVISEVFK